VNRTDRPARYLEISNRDPADGAEYPDDDLRLAKTPDGKSLFTRKNGSSYQREPPPFACEPARNNARAARAHGHRLSVSALGMASR
jgi:hypothetical protein